MTMTCRNSGRNIDGRRSQSRWDLPEVEWHTWQQIFC